MTDQFIITDLGEDYIRHHSCRWPIGDPHKDGFRFCGRQAERGAFCGEHGDVAYRPRKPGPDPLMRLASLD